MSVHTRVAIAAGLVLAAGMALVGVGTAAVGNAAAADSVAVRPTEVPALALSAPRHTAAPRAHRQPPPTHASKPAAPAPVTTPAAAPPPPAPHSVEQMPAPPVPLVPGTPCTVTARACVDLGQEVSWLINNGVVVNGPEEVASGDAQTPTPRGTFKVQWKAEQYTSREYLVQMPYSVFFADGGIAFHEGNRDTPSGGCVKLERSDAVEWFNFLQVGDEVQIR